MKIFLLELWFSDIFKNLCISVESRKYWNWDSLVTKVFCVTIVSKFFFFCIHAYFSVLQCITVLDINSKGEK